MKISYKYLFFLLSMVLFPSCLKESEAPSVEFDIGGGAEIIHYLESKGDYINSSNVPAFVEASEVFQNLSNYLIIDVRSPEQYILGHIENAVNVTNQNLLPFFESNNLTKYLKIVLVSQTGQSAAYYTSLLSLLGYNNLYSLNFGMASWNSIFADPWLLNSNVFIDVKTFTNEFYNKRELTTLPALTFNKTSLTIEEKLKERISLLLNEGFEDISTQPENIKSSITVDHLFADFNNYYVICYASGTLYTTSSPLSGDPLSGFGHPSGAVLYNPQEDLKSTNFLQTLPINLPITVYSYNGQLSAYITAYLRLLGYDAKSLLFGANNLIYTRMIWAPRLYVHAFTTERIMNFPYTVN